MQQTFKRELTRAIGFGIGLFLAVVTINALVQAHLASRVGTLMEKQAEVALQSNVVDSLVSLKEEYVVAQQYSVLLQNALPLPDKLINFPKEVKEMAAAHDLEITFSFSSQEASAGGKPGSIAYQMALKGSYDDIASFLKAFEGHPYFTSETSVTLNTAGLGQYAAVVNGKVFTR